jgi:HPt (histidine-containing phosphotransfer) domain-containing protein
MALHGVDDAIWICDQQMRIALERAGRRQKPKPALDQKAIDNLRDLQMKGEPDILGELGGLFLEGAPHRIKAMIDALSNGDPNTLCREAHNLKSSSANLGAVRLSEICADLEAIGRSSRLGNAQDLAAQAVVEFKRVKAALQAEIAKGAGFSI